MEEGREWGGTEGEGSGGGVKEGGGEGDGGWGGVMGDG